MREIKFRAWDKFHKRMYRVESIYFEDEYISLFTNTIYDNGYDSIKLKLSEVELMQYTGLKDKNGVEIYSGDNFGKMGGDVNRPDEYEFWATVYFDEDFAAFCVETCSGGWEYLHDYLDKNYCEIIGNIYENPDLLT